MYMQSRTRALLLLVPALVLLAMHCGANGSLSSTHLATSLRIASRKLFVTMCVLSSTLQLAGQCCFTSSQGHLGLYVRGLSKLLPLLVMLCAGMTSCVASLSCIYMTHSSKSKTVMLCIRTSGSTFSNVQRGNENEFHHGCGGCRVCGMH